MISIYVGKPGMGKTYSLVRIALKSIKAGKDVYSNFFIDFSSLKIKSKKPLGKIYFWKKPEDLVDIRQGEILIDEAQIYFNSRKWRELDERLQYKLQQHRKQGLNIWGAVQHYRRIDTIARELVNSVHVVRKLGTIFVTREYDIEDMEKAKKRAHGFSMFVLDKKIAKCYDTMQEISTMHQRPEFRFSKVDSVMGKQIDAGYL